MNKKIIVFLAGLLLCVAFLLTGCENKNNNKIPPQGTTEILEPYVLTFGSYIWWDEAKNATEYEIYCDDLYLDTVNTNSYQIGEIKVDTEFYVVAKGYGKQSDKSNVVLVSKNCNFSNTEILDLSNKSSSKEPISSTIRKVIIGNQNASTFEFTSIIEERSTDITFELHNVDIQGEICTFDHSYSKIKNNYNFIFDIEGDCSIKGNNGNNGFDFSDSRHNNRELDAGKGSNGGNAIIVPTAIITGCGNLKLFGGNGGNGGVGSSTTQNGKKPGKGSDGGKGGEGIKSSYTILNLVNNNCLVAVVDGKGGEKGKPGKILNNNLEQGIVNITKEYDIGKNGSDGQSVFGVINVISGQLKMEAN